MPARGRSAARSAETGDGSVWRPHGAGRRRGAVRLSETPPRHYARSSMEVLQLDMSGRPQSWVSAKEAAVIYASDGVAWTLGDPFYVLRGGMQRRTGLQSRIEVHPIIAVRGAVPVRAWRQTPALSNPKLFVRDRHVCAYCGGDFHLCDLTPGNNTPTAPGRPH